MLERWEGLPLTGPRPRSIAYIGMPGATEGGTTTFVACGDRAEALFVVKVFRHGSERAATEAMVLDHLRHQAPWSADVVPRLIHRTRIAGTVALIESIVPGRQMPIKVRSDGLPDPAPAATDFGAIAALTRRLRACSLPIDRAGLPGANLACVPARYAELFDPSPPERALLRELEDALPRLPRTPILHGDLCRQNVLVTERGAAACSVIDWTDAELDAPALEDFLFFVATYFVQARGTGFASLVDGFETTFFGVHPYAAAVRTAFNASCAATGVEPDLRLHLGLLAARQAVRHAERLMALPASQPLPRFVVWLAAANQLNYSEARRTSMWRYYFQRLATVAGRAGKAA
jgi:hypothetical protein